MGRKSTLTPINTPALRWVLLLAGLGCLGLYQPQSGNLGSFGYLAWISLLAFPAGIGCSAGGARFWPHGLLIPGIWSCLMVLSSLATSHPLQAPLSAMAAVSGLFFAGFGLGCFLRKWAVRAAFIALFSLLLLVASAQRGGLGRPQDAPARSQPALARNLVNASPLVFVFECAGEDWTHDNPRVYAQSGVEWFPRSAYDGTSAGVGALLLGILLAISADRLRQLRASRAQA